jgi:DNA-binding beta-propeller fold protein YncE
MSEQFRVTQWISRMISVPRRGISGNPISRWLGIAILGVVLSNLGLGVKSSGAAEWLYVSMQNNEIHRYDVSLSTALAVESSRQTFVPAGQGLSSPMGLAFDTTGNLYVANNSSNTVTRYDSSGARIGTFFVPSGQGLNVPTGLTFDSSGNLYVANVLGSTIAKYDSSGARIGTFFVPGGQGLNTPYGLAFDATGNLYAANSGSNTITRYDSSGARIGTDFVPTGQGLNVPIGLAFDSSNYLYAANTSGSANTITRYDTSGNRIGTDFTTGLNGPSGLAFGSSGNLYVANGGAQTISKLNSAGTVLFSWSTPSGALSPRFLAFVPEPSTYVLCGLATGVLAVLARRKQRAAKAIAH